MHIKVDLDITPEEVRRLMGLPDMQGFQDEMMARIREQMELGAEGYDPMTLMRPYFNNAFASMDTFQKMMAGVMGMAEKKEGKD